MLKLILRQIAKNWRGLAAVLLIWIIGGYFIFSYRYLIPVFLSSKFAELPDAGSEDPEKAYRVYVLRSEELLGRRPGFWCLKMPSVLGGCSEDELSRTGVRLDLMEKACGRMVIRSRLREDVHWMEKLREWNLEEERGGMAEPALLTVEPDKYWKENQEKVLTALKMVTDASHYAWEIPGSLTESGEELLIAERISTLARAVCRDDLALISWGNYIEHLEKKALAVARSKPGFEQTFPYRTEKELFILNSLRSVPNYERALREYTAGIPPDHGITTCQVEPMNLICASPAESIRANVQLIYFLPERELPFLYLKIGRLYLTAEDGEENLRKAHEYFAASARYQATDIEARLGLIHIHLSNRNYAGAYALAADLYNRYEDIRYDPRFRKFTRSILTAIGRSRDADCFAERTEMITGIRKHCEEFKFQ